jgi:putative FmdB family regulatory protein
MPNYDYQCENCDNVITLNRTIADRDLPIIDSQCDCCRSVNSFKRTVAAPSFIYDGYISPLKRAGDGWKEVQQKIAQGSGKKNTIRTK